MPYNAEIVREGKAILEELRRVSAGGQCAFRGHSMQWPSLTPTLCRPFKEFGFPAYSECIKYEEQLLSDFCSKSYDYLSLSEQRHIAKHGRRYSTSAMMVAQHYGLPTRVLDWTHSPWIGLYFAVSDHFDDNGDVWWLNITSLIRWLDELWPRIGVKRRPNDGQADYEDLCFREIATPFVTSVFSRVPFARLEVQQGFHTFSSQFVEDQEATLQREVGSECVGKIQIPREVKGFLLDDLRAFNITSTSLLLPKADHIALALSGSFTEKLKLKRGLDLLAAKTGRGAKQ